MGKSDRLLGKPAPNVPPALYQWLRNYPFHGNIRELEGMVFDAVTRCQGSILPLQSFKEMGAGEIQALDPFDTQSSVLASGAGFPNRLPTLKEAEKALIGEALSRADGNQGVAAGLLGISRQALNKRLIRRDSEVL